MRGLTLDGVGLVSYRTDLPDPSVRGAGDAAIAVRRAGRCGSDLHPYEGRERGRFGVVPGHEGGGEVGATGGGGRRPRPGARGLRPDPHPPPRDGVGLRPTESFVTIGRYKGRLNFNRRTGKLATRRPLAHMFRIEQPT